MEQRYIHTEGGAYVGGHVEAQQFVGRDQINVFVQVDSGLNLLSPRLSEDLMRLLRRAHIQALEDERNEVTVEDIITALECGRINAPSIIDQTKGYIGTCPNVHERDDGGSPGIIGQLQLERVLTDAFHRLLTNYPANHVITVDDLMDDVWQHADGMLLQQLLCRIGTSTPCPLPRRKLSGVIVSLH